MVLLTMQLRLSVKKTFKKCDNALEAKELGDCFTAFVDEMAVAKPVGFGDKLLLYVRDEHRAK